MYLEYTSINTHACLKRFNSLRIRDGDIILEPTLLKIITSASERVEFSHIHILA